jgi:tetratricopeptide (TPR) repeat protein
MSKIKILMIPLIAVSSVFGVTQKEAISTYKNKNYKKSFSMFLELLQKDNYKNLNYNFYLGMSAEKIGNYSEAIAAFERILFYKPDNIRAKLELAKIYYNIKQYSNSKKYFEEVLKTTKNKAVIKHIKYYLSKIKDTYKKDYLDFIAMLSYGFDSNINNTTDSNSYIVYINNTPVNVNNSSKKTGRSVYQEAFVTKYRHKFENVDFNNELTLFNAHTAGYSNKDLQLFKYTPSLLFDYKDSYYNVGVDYSNIRYESDPYISQTGAFISISNKLTTTLSNKLSFRTYLKNYILQKNNNKDSMNYEISDTLSKDISDKNSAYINLKYLTERKKRGELTTVDNNQYSAKIGDNYKLSYTLMLSPSLGYQYKYYTDKDAFFKKHRIDNQLSLNLKATKIFKSFMLQSSLKYINNNSNIEPYKYSKWLFNLTFVKQFKGL